jgi:diacylglycerol O-acyltransferase / wax synthase
MEQLTGLQNLYLQVESDAAPMHTSSLTIYDRRTGPAGPTTFQDIQRFFAARSQRAGVFRRRLVKLPLSIARPYWIDDPGFDIEYHLRHIALPKPGDWRQLCAQVARLHARPLDHKRPLWECYVIEELDAIPGLPPGSFALFLKTHCSAEGETLSAQLFAALHELSPDSRASPPKIAPLFDRVPTFVDLVSRTAIDAVRRPLGLVRHAAAQVRPLLALGAAQVSALARWLVGGGARGETGAAPRTRFNGRVSPHRVVDGVRFDIADVERMRDCVEGATVNDVAIAIIAGGLSRYLDARLEPPAASLVAEAPLASRSATRVFGTRTFADSAIMSLHTDCEDPAERLRLIARQTHRLGQESGAMSGRRLMQEMMEFVPAFALGMAGEAAQRVRLGSLLSPIANATVTSLRGPDVPLYMAGATLVGYYGFPPVHDLAGLAHAIGYYNGAMSIGVAACRTMLPDPARYAQCLRDACADLAEALGVQLAGSERRSVSVAEIPRGAALRARKGRRTPGQPGRAKRDAAAAA